MWPLSYFRHRSHQRRVDAAIAVLIGAYACDHLTAEQKEKVEEQVKKYLDFAGVSKAEYRRFCMWEGRAAFRVCAMARLGLSTGVDGLFWRDFMRPIWKFNPGLLVFAFRHYDSATAETRALLREKGLEVPDREPSEKSFEERVADIVAHRPASQTRRPE